MEHTKGPWNWRTVEQQADYSYKLWDGKSEPTWGFSSLEPAVLSACNQGFIGCSAPDATLISAAPDLLEALKNLLGWTLPVPDDVLNRAKAAVSKAEGKTK